MFRMDIDNWYTKQQALKIEHIYRANVYRSTDIERAEIFLSRYALIQLKIVIMYQGTLQMDLGDTDDGTQLIVVWVR